MIPWPCPSPYWPSPLLFTMLTGQWIMGEALLPTGLVRVLLLAARGLWAKPAPGQLRMAEAMAGGAARKRLLADALRGRCLSLYLCDWRQGCAARQPLVNKRGISLSGGSGGGGYSESQATNGLQLAQAVLTGSGHRVLCVAGEIICHFLVLASVQTAYILAVKRVSLLFAVL
ncbi:hypothetical protein DFAR_3190003 [Desulfarculales bacterium]